MTAVVIASAVILGCRRSLCSPAQFGFSGGTSSVFPDEDSIKVGDTSWFSSSIPTQLKYKHGGNADSGVYNLSGASNVGTDIHFTSLKGFNTQTGAVDSFSFIPVKGNIKNNPLPNAIGASKTVSFLEENGSFNLSFAIIAQKKGIYLISILDIYQATKNCDHISVSILENNVDAHLQYLQDIYYGGQPVNTIDSTHSYCFKVY